MSHPSGPLVNPICSNRACRHAHFRRQGVVEQTSGPRFHQMYDWDTDVQQERFFHLLVLVHDITLVCVNNAETYLERF